MGDDYKSRGRKTTLFFGKIPLEIALARCATEKTAGLNMFNPETKNAIALKRVDKVTGAEVPKVVKGKKIGDDVFIFSDDEIDSFSAAREKDIHNVRVEDIGDIRDTHIKSVYYVEPQNQTFWGLIAGRLEAKNKQARFLFVEGNQDREAIFRIEKGIPKLYVLFFDCEVKEAKQVKAVCKPELAAQVDTLFAQLNEVPIAKPDDERSKLIEGLIEARITGKTIEVIPSIQKKEEKTAEELLAASLR